MILRSRWPWVSSQIFALSRISREWWMMEKQASPPQVIASRKDQVRANLINLTRLNFSPLKLLHYFSIIPHSLVNTRYFQLSTSFFQCRWSTTIHDTTPIKRIRNQIYNFIHRSASKHSKSLQDKIPRLPNTSKSFQTLLVEKYRCTCSSTSRRNFEIPYENPKITDRRRDLHRNETKLFLHHSNSRRNYGRVSPIDFEAFPVSWPAGHTLGKVRGDGAKNLAQPYLLPSNPGWKPGLRFFNAPEQPRFRCSKAVAGALTSRGTGPRKESFKRTLTGPQTHLASLLSDPPFIFFPPAGKLTRAPAIFRSLSLTLCNARQRGPILILSTPADA